MKNVQNDIKGARETILIAELRAPKARVRSTIVHW